MTKGRRKTNRRLKKTVRKTLGTLFLISAIVVAAIPTEGLRAEEDIATLAADGHTHNATHSSSNAKYKVSIRRNASEKASDLLNSGSGIPVMEDLIPIIEPTDTIYTTGTNADGTSYQFAYKMYDNDWAAIILGYNKSSNLPNNTLTIPDTVNAYIQPTGNMGTGQGYVAASSSGEPLYYEKLTEQKIMVDTTEQKVDSDGQPVYDTNGAPVYVQEEKTYYTGEMTPCYATVDEWKDLPLENFYYYKAGSNVTSAEAVESYGGAKKVYDDFAQSGGDSTHQWIKAAAVKYIGNQYLDVAYDNISHTSSWSIPNDGKGNYITESNADKGVFATAGNISTLNIGENLVGIGNFAFYECTSLSSVSFGNGLKVVGNWAFAACGSLNNVAIPDACLLQQIGDHAFYSCIGLDTFRVPVSVKFIGDYAFAECSFLNSIDLCNSGKDRSASILQELGWNVFENCQTLSSLTFPYNYRETPDISIVKGCKNLHYIASQGDSFSFEEKTDNVYCFDCFKEMLSGEPVNGTFYFEGTDASSLHDLAKDNCFAFSYVVFDSNVSEYVSQDKYELTVQDPKVLDETGRSTYVVDSSNKLISCSVGRGVETLDMPDPIGPYHIYNIDDNIFSNYCNLKMVSLPASVQTIGANAFRGCHNLATVVFNNSSVVIGEDAFKTQYYTGAQHINCSGVKTEADGTPSVKLKFVGEISSTSTPYLYAMSENGRYNNESQVKSYVTYCSGWPSNLIVQYNSEKQVSELTDFPAFSELSKYANQPEEYPYLTDEQRSAASTALNKYGVSALTENEQSFIDSALSIKIPDGVQAIADGLFKDKEDRDVSAGYINLEKKVTLFGLDNIEAEDFQGATSLTALYSNGEAASIEAGAFKGCSNLKTVEINGNTTSIGDKAFEDCAALTDVTLSGTISDLGIIPFTGCSNLKTVNFTGTDHFSCDNSIIYGMSDGAKARIVECLEGRESKYIKAEETAGVTSMAPSAFEGCEQLREIDLSQSAITTVPERAFADTTSLQTVKLPLTCTTIQNDAFNKSHLDRLEGVQNVSIVSDQAFNEIDKKDNPKDLLIVTPKDSFMWEYGTTKGFTVEETSREDYYTVIFRDWNEELGQYVNVDTQTVKAGEDAVAPEPAGKSGEIFQYWDPDYREVSEDRTCVAFYSKEDPDANKLTVIFQDWDGTLVKEIKVAPGGSIADADLPNTSNLVRDGYVFIGWDRTLTNITESFTTMAVYKALSEDDIVVRYINGVTREVFYQTTIKKGAVAPSILTPTVSGYTFKEWLPDISAAITEDTDFYAIYETAGSDSSSSPSPDGSNSPNPGTSNSPSPGASNSPNPGASNSPNPGASTSPGNNGTSVKMYTLTVKNGSGSGSYVAGSQPIIIANDPASGMQFSNWTIDPSNTTIASKVLSATVITMPEGNVTVTANYTKASRSSTSTSTGSGNSTNSNSNRRPNSTTTGNLSGGRTTVVIDKNGLSNTGVVSATVNGSSDNFVIKITESASASEEVVKALMAEYGNDISAIKYFPMDISLYDSTGNNKITDTTGLSISITLPIPDSLITYAGNNKVAGVVNSKLDKLTPKFSTISGVSCITFTAEHFSPYVIYVDTNNLTAGTITDSTPKTGDGIHPKWFLSIGLACISMVLFMKKDKRTLKKVRA